MDSKEYIDQIQQLGKRMVDEGSQAWERYVQSLSSSGSNKPDIEGMQEDYINFAKNEGAEYMRKIMQCNLDYYNSLLNAGMDFTNDIITNMGRTSQAPDNKPTSNDQEPHTRPERKLTELHFHGKLKTTIDQSFMMANNQDKPVKVGFEVSEFISEDGKNKIRLPVKFKPDSFELKSGHEQLIECFIKLDGKLDTSQQYAAVARVIGFPEMLIRLVVSVDS